KLGLDPPCGTFLHLTRDSLYALTLHKCLTGRQGLKRDIVFMRALIITALAVCLLLLSGCCRPWFSSADDPPSSPPRHYGQAHEAPPANSYKPPSYSSGKGQYVPRTNGYGPASPQMPVPRTNNSYQY